MKFKRALQMLPFALLMVVAPIAAIGQDENSKDRLVKIRRQLAAVREEQNAISKSLLELIEKHGTIIMSRERVLEEMGQLEDEAWSSKIEREQAAIRSEVLRDRLAKMITAAKEADSQDEIGALLEKKLAIASAKRTRVEALRKTGTAPESEVEDAEEQVTDAQLALAQHREAKKQSPEAEEIKAISRELAEIESDVIVKSKTADIYLKRAAELKGSLLQTAEYTDLQRMEESLNRRREHWEELALQLETDESALSDPKPESKSDK
jgi:hypothetical protein